MAPYCLGAIMFSVFGAYHCGVSGAFFGSGVGLLVDLYYNCTLQIQLKLYEDNLNHFVETINVKDMSYNNLVKQAQSMLDRLRTELRGARQEIYSLNVILTTQTLDATSNALDDESDGDDHQIDDDDIFNIDPAFDDIEDEQHNVSLSGTHLRRFPRTMGSLRRRW